MFLRMRLFFSALGTFSSDLSPSDLFKPALYFPAKQPGKNSPDESGTYIQPMKIAAKLFVLMADINPGDCSSQRNGT
jgi:hypothetical protein